MGQYNSLSMGIVANIYDNNNNLLAELDEFIIDTGYSSGLWLGNTF